MADLVTVRTLSSEGVSFRGEGVITLSLDCLERREIDLNSAEF